MVNEFHINKFVSARLVNEGGTRQGWVTNIFKDQSGDDSKTLFIIRGQSGNLYVCEDRAVIVDNPPKRNY